RAHLDGRPLFLEDDLALVELLGSLTVRAVQREQVIADLADAQRAIREAENVRASEARFRALLDAEPNAMLSVNSAGVIQWCTRTAERMFGADDGGLVGRRLDELVPQTKGSTRPTGETSEVVRYETTGTRGGGATFPAEVAISPLEFDGAPATLAVISDITWRYEAERIRDRFIGILSHELRTPITSIFGGAQVLLKRWDALEAETRAELISDVAGEAERLQRMVENLLVLARVEQGADLADVSPVLLQRSVSAVAAREGTSWPAMDLQAQPFEDLPPVAADEASVSLILRNLISNAGKYAGPSATVRVLVEPDGPDAVAVRVRDDGPGLDAGDQDQLFRLYFRSSAADAVPGSGIGLFVCRELVVAMGGRIWATAAPGGGAEFGFTLPVYTEAAPVESNASQSTPRLREWRPSTPSTPSRAPAPTT
ncbi:MAG: ATP-binding protein, partial [Chloroflexota bacterium]